MIMSTSYHTRVMRFASVGADCRDTSRTFLTCKQASSIEFLSSKYYLFMERVLDECVEKFPNILALKDLLQAKDVVAILPTDFGKSLIPGSIQVTSFICEAAADKR